MSMAVTSRWPNNELQSGWSAERPSGKSSANRKLGKTTEILILYFIFSLMIYFISHLPHMSFCW